MARVVRHESCSYSCAAEALGRLPLAERVICSGPRREPYRYLIEMLPAFIFFFQAEDGIRDRNVTGVQTCALPIFIISPYFLTHERASLSTATNPGSR